MCNDLYKTTNGYAEKIFMYFQLRLFGEGLVYFAAMSFSTFYHTCDEATSSYADFPGFLDNICARLFVDNQVLQVNIVKISSLFGIGYFDTTRLMVYALKTILF